MRVHQATAQRGAGWHYAWLLVSALCVLAVGCKSSDDGPSAPDSGAGGAAEPGGDNEAGASAQPQGGAASMGGAGQGEGGDINMPGAGGAPTEPGSWDESFWDEAVWQ